MSASASFILGGIVSVIVFIQILLLCCGIGMQQAACVVAAMAIQVDVFFVYGLEILILVVLVVGVQVFNMKEIVGAASTLATDVLKGFKIVSAVGLCLCAAFLMIEIWFFMVMLSFTRYLRAKESGQIVAQGPAPYPGYYPPPMHPQMGGAPMPPPYGQYPYPPQPMGPVKDDTESPSKQSSIQKG